jgi:hypothetical protein
MTPIGRLALGVWLRTACLVALAGAFYAASGPIARVAAATIGVACQTHGLRLECALPPDGALDSDAYVMSAAALAIAWGGGALFLRDRPVQPFIALFAALGLGAIVYDLVVGRPLETGVRLINDTFDVLRFLVFASFALLLTIARRWIVSPSAVAMAATTSFGAAILSMVAFYAIRPGLIGAFELYVLYIAYAFGGFTLHLMTLSRLVAGVRPRSGAGGDLHDLAGGETGELGLAGGGRHDRRPHQAAAHHAVDLGAGAVDRRELAGVGVDVATANIFHLAESHLAQAVAFRGAHELRPGRGGAGPEQNG